jgi:co-chaperonin GroES (HSP10)
MEMKMKNKYLLIQEIEQQEHTTQGGIIIPTEKYNRKAIVINAGDSEHIKAGDVILKNIGLGTTVTLDNVEFEILHAKNIIAILEEHNG